VVGFVLYGSLVLLPLMLQTLLGYPSLQAGIALAPRGMGSFIAMPLVGVVMSRVDARKLLAAGIVVGAFTLFWLGSLNRSLGYWDIFWPQFLQGLGLGLLFVPLTTITMGPIPRENMGNATSIFNLMRNLGGSMGIAAATTMLARHRQEHTNTLVSHVDAYNPQARAMLEQMRAAFVAQGADLVTAAQRARLALFGMVEREAMMLSFTDIFRWLALMFLALLPLLLLMRSPARGRPGPGAAH
jgi:DHA2 family multidrug resistance protein